MKLQLLALAATLMAVPAFAAVKTYQVTGPVLELKDDKIVVQKGSEKWEISRDASTEVKGELKEGAKVTIQYRMSAAQIEAKGASEKPAKTKKK